MKTTESAHRITASSRVALGGCIRIVPRSFVVIVLCIGVVACHPRVDRAKADALAAQRLQEFAKEEGLKAELFTKPDVREAEGKWLYSFDYPAPPRQSVAIIVSTKGTVEVSRMFDSDR
jgi:hypothetical protein